MIEPTPQPQERADLTPGPASHVPDLQAARLPDPGLARVSQLLCAALEEIHPYLAAQAAQPPSYQLKADCSVVTEADKEVERRLREKLASILPEAVFLGEESVSSDPEASRELFDSEYLWIVDPIDGTSNFANGLPLFACSVGLWRRDGAGQRPALGAILIPTSGEIVYSDGGSVFARNIASGRETQIQPAHPSLGAGALVILPSSFHKHFELENTGALKSFRQLGSTVLDILYTALGKGAASVTDAHAWDFAGAIAIAQSLKVGLYSLATGEQKSAFLPSDFSFGPDPKTNWRLKEPYVVGAESNAQSFRTMVRLKGAPRDRAAAD